MKFRCCNPLETEYPNYVKLLKSGLTTEQAITNLEPSKPPLEDLRINITCNRYGIKNKAAHWRTFCSGVTIRMLCQLWRQCKKWLLFSRTKMSIYWSSVVHVHYQTWLTFIYTNLPLHNSIPSQKETTMYWKNLENTSLVVYLSFLQANQLLIKLLFEILNICKSFVRIDASQRYPYSICQPMPQIFIRVVISMKRPIGSHLDKTRPVALEKWSCFISANKTRL